MSSRATEGGARLGREGSGSETSIRFLASLGMTEASLGMTEVTTQIKAKTTMMWFSAESGGLACC
ncbi:MAG: hypothetical protein PHV77_04690 [Candidatus Omnitrophica bacterium]|nr:hypothetical protein [Candidatus Omnitrophota bacterium]